jgi:hypothetical protein
LVFAVGLRTQVRIGSVATLTRIDEENNLKTLKLHRVGVLAAFAMAIVPSCLFASTLTFATTTPIPLTSTDWSESLSFPTFDTSLGTLTSVTLDLTGSLNTTITVGNISDLVGSPAPSSGTVNTQSVLTLRDPDNLLIPLPQLGILSPGQTYSLPADSGAPFSLDPQEATLSGSNTYTSSSLLAEFSGAGPIVLPASTSTTTILANKGGNTYSSQSTEAALTGTITYTYTRSVQAPEPSALALVGVGLVGMAGYVWRVGRRRHGA